MLLNGFRTLISTAADWASGSAIHLGARGGADLSYGYVTHFGLATITSASTRTPGRALFTSSADTTSSMVALAFCVARRSMFEQIPVDTLRFAARCLNSSWKSDGRFLPAEDLSLAHCMLELAIYACGGVRPYERIPELERRAGGMDPLIRPIARRLLLQALLVTGERVPDLREKRCTAALRLLESGVGIEGVAYHQRRELIHAVRSRHLRAALSVLDMPTTEATPGVPACVALTERAARARTPHQLAELAEVALAAIEQLPAELTDQAEERLVWLLGTISARCEGFLQETADSSLEVVCARASRIVARWARNVWEEETPPALALALANFHLGNFLMNNSTFAIEWADYFAQYAVQTAAPDDLERWLYLRTALSCAQHHMARTRRPSDLLWLLDQIEAMSPLQREYEAMGSLCSNVVGTGFAPGGTREYADRCVRYYDRARHLGGDTSWHKAQSATALLVRGRFCPTSASEDFLAAAQLARAAFLVKGFQGDMRTVFCYSAALFTLAHQEKKPAMRREAIRIQLLGLRELRRRLAMRRLESSLTRRPELGAGSIRGARLALPGQPTIVTDADLIWWVSSSEDPESAELITWLYQNVAKETRVMLFQHLQASVNLFSYAFNRRRYREAAQVTHFALRMVQDVSSTHDPRSALTRTQGLSALGAWAAVKAGDPRLAVELLEAGAAMRTRGQLPNRAAMTSMDVLALANELGVPICYLVTTSAIGLAIVAVPGRAIESVRLPELTDSVVERWLDLMGSEADVNVDQQHPVRGPRGSRVPPRAAVDLVLQQARAALAPLLLRLHDHRASSVQVIPMGLAAGIPWSPVLEEVLVAIAPSSTVLRHALRAGSRASGPAVALTAPSPCRFAGEDYPELFGARQEGVWLENRYQALHRTGPDATAGAFREALGTDAMFVHVGTHGQVDPDAWDEAHLLWAAAGEEASEVTELKELSTLEVRSPVVFLAACWGGTPNRLLPDEAISFPAALLARGVQTVIAPLWPVDDDAAYTLVTAFYELWLTHGKSPNEALHLARERLRTSRAHRNSTTWAAFSLTGPLVAGPAAR